MVGAIDAAEYYNELIADNKIIEDLELNDNDKIEVRRQIDLIRKDDFEDVYKKGLAFEKLIKKIFESAGIFHCIWDKHTSSNEFDILVKLNFHGRNLRDKKIIPEWIPDKFLIECKNKNEAANVELVGKFFSLVSQTDMKLGIFISKNSISGKFDKNGKREKYWKHAMAFINKIYLKYAKSVNGIVLIDLDLNDIENVLNDKFNIMHIIEARKDQIENDINDDISEWIAPHENLNFINL